MRTSETITIKRSKINLNPYNPKKHTDEQIKLQKKNIKKNGYLGGIVWNSASGNLIDGHRRVLALDSINKYDGSEETDYEIKVEKVAYTDKEEKEQMTYMALGNSKADYNLVALYIDEIDALEIGISEAEYEKILELRDVEEEIMEMEEMEDIDDMFAPKEQPKKAEEPKKEVFELETDERSGDDMIREHEEMPHATADEIKAKKTASNGVVEKRQTKEDAFVIISFDDDDQKMAFCETLGLEYSRNMIVNGAEFMEMLDL